MLARVLRRGGKVASENLQSLVHRVDADDAHQLEDVVGLEARTDRAAPSQVVDAPRHELLQLPFDTLRIMQSASRAGQRACEKVKKMPLLSLWESNKDAVNQLSIEQVVSTAGDGILKDDSLCSNELRSYLSQIPSDKIGYFIAHCLNSNFLKSGFVLQDMINELGRRLDYQVMNGRYQGTSNRVGFDGLWISPEGHAIIAEVKTTDAYRLSLDKLAEYRSKLLSDQTILGKSSVLIIVGREDTGELEAQVRGSRHAWDFRLISAEALLRLVRLKENADGPDTGRKIRSLLAPMEYTRLDRMIDVMFTTVIDVETAVASTALADVGEAADDRQSTAQDALGFTDSGLLQAKRDLIIRAICSDRKKDLIRKSRALYWSADHNLRIACSISKRYRRDSSRYWYAYHPQWNDFLADGSDALFVLGCMDLDFAFAIDRKTLCERLELLNTTTKEDGMSYWHIHIVEREEGSFALSLPKSNETLSLQPFILRLPTM